MPCKVPFDFPRGLSVNSAYNVPVTCEDLKTALDTSSGELVITISDSSYLWQAVEPNNGLLLVSRNGPVHGIATVS